MFMPLYKSNTQIKMPEKSTRACTFLYNASLLQSRITMLFRLARISMFFFLIMTSVTRPEESKQSHTENKFFTKAKPEDNRKDKLAESTENL